MTIYGMCMTRMTNNKQIFGNEHCKMSPTPVKFQNTTQVPSTNSLFRIIDSPGLMEGNHTI